MPPEKDLEERLYEVSNAIYKATHKLEEIPLEEWDSTLDAALKNLKRINKEIGVVIWMIQNPEDEEELS